MRLCRMMGWTPLLLLLLISTVSLEYSPVKIRFGENSSRPVRDPAGDVTSFRRSFWNPRHALCQTAGSTAGALVAHRLTSTGALSRGERVPGHSVFDLRSFISLVATAATQGLDSSTGCPRPLLQSSAEEMSMAVICASGGLPVQRERCLAQALQKNGVLQVMPALIPYSSPVLPGCVGSHFNFKIKGAADFQNNPQKHATKLVLGLQKEVMEMHNALIAANAKPIEAAPAGLQTEQEFIRAAVQGAVIATYVAKVTAQTGTITNVPAFGRLDLTSFVSLFTGHVIRALDIKPEETAIRAYNIAVKMSLYWLLNNYNLLKPTPSTLLTGNTLINLGLAPYFPPVPRLSTNNDPVRPVGIFIAFSDVQESLEATSAIMESRIPFPQIKQEIENMLPSEPIPVSDEVIRLQTVPPQGPAGQIGLANQQDKEEGAQGSLPRPEDWFSANVPATNASKEINAVLLGTLAVVVGAYGGTIMPQIGLVTRDEEPGYDDLVTTDVYLAIQHVLEQLVNKLMTVIPMSLDQGFYILNAAFKTAKLTLNLETQTEKLPGTSTLIPLGLKYHDILKFHPELQHIQWDLWPLPSTIRVLYLWVKPALKVNLRETMNERIQTLARIKFPELLADIVSIMKYHAPGLNIYNIKTIEAKVRNALPWDPPEILSYLYDPSPCDGVPKPPSEWIDPPRTPLTCPGHFLCPPDSCSLSSCANYVCTSKDSWCYFPPDIECPGSISCPVQIHTQGETLVCPEDKNCPIVNIQCPGLTECPDETTRCPGDAKCPLKIKCPGTLCPNRYVARPQTLLPCPGHPLCSKQPLPDQLICNSETSCTYATQSSGDLVKAIQEAGKVISTSLDRKEFSVNINNTAVSNINLDGQKVASSASGATVRDGKSAVASAAAAAASGQKKTGSVVTTTSTTTRRPFFRTDYVND